MAKTKANQIPEIQPLPKRLYKRVYGEKYSSNWRLRFSGLSEKEKRAVGTLLAQYNFKGVYWVPEVNYPESIKTPDLFIDGQKVEIKQISSVRSAREQLHKAVKQVGDNGWTIFDATKSELSSDELLQTIAKRGALEKLSRFALTRNDELVAYQQLAKTTKKVSQATTSFSGRDSRLTYIDILPDTEDFVNPQNDEYWQQRAEERLVASERTGKAYYKRIEEAYNQALRNLTDELREMYRAYYRRYKGFDPSDLKEKIPNGTLKQFQKAVTELGLELPENYQGRLSRIEHLYAQAWLEAQKAGRMEKAISDEAYSEIYQEEYYHNAYGVAHGTNTTPSFSILDQGTVDQVLNTKFYGENYSERIWNNTNVFANELQQLLTSAIASGQGPQKTIRQLRERFGVRKYYAERLLRTETNYFHNQAELDSYAELGISKYKILATLDMRTSEICQRMDGKTYYIKKAKVGVNYPPLHPNCRTTVVAVLNGWAPKERGARDARGNAVTVRGDMSYKEWKEGIVKEVSEAIIDGKYDGKRYVNTAYGVRFDVNTLAGVSPDIIGPFSAEIKSIAEEYPAIKNFMEKRNFTVLAAKRKPTTLASTEARFGNKITLNNYRHYAYYASQESLLKLTRRGTKSKFFMPAEDLLKYPMSHEMGHVVHAYVWQSQKTTLDKISRDIMKIAQKKARLRSSQELKGKYLSEYGRKDPYEEFAEIFANMRCGKPNVLGEAMTEYLKEILR